MWEMKSVKGKIPLRNIVKVALDYCGEDKNKLFFVFEFLSYLIERKAEEEMELKRDLCYSERKQKKIEMKLDHTVMSFVQLSEKLGYSASGMLINVLTKFFGIDFRNNIRRPGRRRMKRKTISLKVPADVYTEIKKRLDEPFNVVARRLMKSFTESPERFVKIERK